MLNPIELQFSKTTPLRFPLRRRSSLRSASVQGIPEVGGGFPFVGLLPAMAFDYLALIRRAEAELGPVFWISSGFGLRQIVCTSPESFGIYKNKITTSVYLNRVMPQVFGNTMISSDGEQHHHMRGAMNSPFLPRGLGASEIGAAFAEMIELQLINWLDQGEIRVLKNTREMVLSLMFRMLGINSTELSEWVTQYETFMLLGINLPIDLPGMPHRRGRRAKAWLDDKLLGYIHRAREDSNGLGLLPQLVNGRDESGKGLSDRDLVDNLRLLVLAGHETSASTMAWMLAILASRPDCFRQLCDEANAAPGIPSSPKELKQFPYAEALFRETLRMFPPVYSDAREALCDFELSGYTIPKGSLVSVPIAYLSRLESQYPDGDSFVPERWINRKEAISPIELIQFGGGPHFCLGYHMAWLEIVQFAVALARGLSRRKLRPELKGNFPAARYVPLQHPAAHTRIKFVSA